MKQVSPEVVEIIRCNLCDENIFDCFKCCDSLVLNEPIYCFEMEHYCNDCKEHLVEMCKEGD